MKEFTEVPITANLQLTVGDLHSFSVNLQDAIGDAVYEVQGFDFPDTWESPEHEMEKFIKNNDIHRNFFFGDLAKFDRALNKVLDLRDALGVAVDKPFVRSK